MISGFVRPLGGASVDVAAGAGIAAQSTERDRVEGVARASVAAAVEPVAAGLAAAGRDRGDTAEVGERGLRTHPGAVVPGGGQQLAGDLDPDTDQLEQAGRSGGDQLLEVGVGRGVSRRSAAGGGEPVAAARAGWPGPDRGVGRSPAGTHPDQDRGGKLPQLLAEVRRSGHQQRLELIDRLGTSLDRAATSHPKGADRLHGAVTALGGARGGCRSARRGGARRPRRHEPADPHRDRRRRV